MEGEGGKCKMLGECILLSTLDGPAWAVLTGTGMLGWVTEPNVQIKGSGAGRLEEGGSQVKSQLRDPNKSSQRRTAVG